MSDHLTEVWDRLPENLRRKINRTESCWLWTGHTDRKGYGLFHRGSGKPKRVPRLIYEAAHEIVLDEETLVCHDCPNGDNLACCNPAHLFLGSHVENRADCVRKGRQAKGETNGRAILTEQQVSEIRRLYVPRKVSASKLGKLFGVSGQTINRVIRGEIWSHVS
jgi:hypothetical protein